MSGRQIWTDPTALEKKEFPTTSLARRLTNVWAPIQFLSPSQLENLVGLSQDSVDDKLLGLLGPYTCM
jgi:hypothetical protein